MLGKLLKHEFKATARYFLFLYSVVIGLAIINKVFWLIETDNIVVNAIRGFMTVAFVVATVASVLFSFIILIYRFQKNLLSDEGYLSFTLPVTASNHILSKMLIGVMWNIITVVVIIGSLLIIAINTGFYSGFPAAWDLMVQFFKANPELIKFVVEFMLMMFIGLFTGTLMLYTAMSIGHLFSKHRVLASILSFFGIYFAIQVLNTIVVGITMATGFGSGNFENFNTSADFTVNNSNYLDISSAFVGGSELTYTSFLNIASTLFIVTILVQVLLGVAYFFTNRFILKRKLNLE